MSLIYKSVFYIFFLFGFLEKLYKDAFLYHNKYQKMISFFFMIIMIIAIHIFQFFETVMMMIQKNKYIFNVILFVNHIFS